MSGPTKEKSAGQGAFPNQPNTGAMVDPQGGGGKGPASLTLQATFFTNVKQTQGIEQALSILELYKKLTQGTTRASKEALPLFRAVTSPGASRADGTPVLQVYALAGDYDGGRVTALEAVERLRAAGVAAFIYTTARHTDEQPRWRVVALLSGPVSPKQHPTLMDGLNGALGGILAPESWEVTRCYFYGRVKGVPFEHYLVDSMPLDLVMIAPDFDPIGKPGVLPRSKPRSTTQSTADRADAIERATAETLDDLRIALDFIDANERDMWIKVGHALACFKGTEHEDDARELWAAWSAKDEKFKPGDEERWDTFSPTSITFKSVFALAKEGGYQYAPRAAAAEEFDIVPVVAEPVFIQQPDGSRKDMTDRGNVSVLAAQTHGNLRYVAERKLWTFWDGARWLQDTHRGHLQLCMAGVAEHWLALEKKEIEAAKNLEGAAQKAKLKVAASYRSWAMRCRSKQGLDAMRGLAESDIRFLLPADALDRDPNLLGADNGVIDLRTGELRAAGRDEYITLRVPFAFDPNTPAPRFEQFVREIMGEPTAVVDGLWQYRERPAMVDYVHKLIGYCATGLTHEHKMAFWTGVGANGKSVLADILRAALGGCYTLPLNSDVLTATAKDADGERATPFARRLEHKRLAIGAETGKQQKLNANWIKQHTGESALSVRGLYEESRTVTVTHKLVLLTNHPPALDHLDEPMRQRIHVVEFLRRWNRPGAPRDPALPDADKELAARITEEELPGVLAWIVAGAVRYHREGLTPPDAVVASTRDYLNEQDPLARWLDTFERCPIAEGMTSRELHSNLEAWCFENDATAPSGKALAIELERLRYESKKGNSARRWGLRIADEATCEYC